MRAAPRAVLVSGLLVLLAACGSNHALDMTAATDDSGVNVYPKTYKSDILAAMHAYLNDPTNIHDAALTEPMLKTVGDSTRYVACVKYNPKKNAKDYAGVKEVAAVFLVGRLDRFVDNPKDVCSGVAYAPFPELQKLPP